MLVYEKAKGETQDGLAETICELIIRRCNMKSEYSDEPVKKCKELIDLACGVLREKLRKRRPERDSLMDLFLELAENRPSYIEGENSSFDVRGHYIPAMIIARRLYYHEENTDIKRSERNKWNLKFYKLLGRLIFAMGFGGEDDIVVVAATKTELELCSVLFTSLSQETFDVGLITPISFKLMQGPDLMKDTLVNFIAIFRKVKRGHLFANHIDSGLNLSFTIMHFLRTIHRGNTSCTSFSGLATKDDHMNADIDELQYKCIDLLSALVKACPSKAIIPVSKNLTEELSFRGSTDLNHRMTLYTAFEECALAVNKSQLDLIPDDLLIFDENCDKVIATLTRFLHSETTSGTSDNTDAFMKCEAALEAWIILNGGEYDPSLKMNEKENSYFRADSRSSRLLSSKGDVDENYHDELADDDLLEQYIPDNDYYDDVDGDNKVKKRKFYKKPRNLLRVFLRGGTRFSSRL